ncbi:MAG: outer membrane protein assembly factor BamB family protein, partial [Planctomycetota bacterium]
MRQRIAAGGQAPSNVRPAIAGVAASVCVLFAAGARAGSARAILDASGVRGGLIVHVGCGDGKLTAALRASESYLVHGLDTDAARIDQARRAIKAKGLYGPVSVAAFDGRELPYADGSVNLVIVERGYEVQEAEILRVLAPHGVALVGGRKITKPVPEHIDEWSHFLQGPENNPVAEDTLVGPPRRMQWAAGPRWLRSHEVPSGITSMVTAGGRIFYTLDEGPIGITDSRLPEKWALYARDAFNGTLLWKIPVPDWGWQTWRSQLKRDFKGTDWIRTSGLRTSVPGDYAYRMVADGERLYFTLGNKAPVSVIDAATGKVIATCAGSNSPKQLLLSDGVLIAYTSGRILAFESSTGKALWKKDVKAASVAAHGRRLVYRAGGNDVRCLDLGSGEQLWKAGASVAGRLVISGDVILLVSGSSMQALSLESGKAIWNKGKAGSKRRSRGRHPGVYIVGDTIWTGYRGQRVSLKTGKKLPSVNVRNLWSPQHHHRCYPNKATSRYIIGAMEGLEYLALKGDGHSRNNWVRGACRLGIMPANGMTYVPFDQCYCSAGVKLLGFTALTAAKASPPVEPAAKRLERGPAYGTAVGRAADASADWPAFRHDSLRSGAVATSVPAEITPGWRRELKGPLTQPVVAGDLLCVASRDTHTVHALDANTGRERWSFT